MKYLLTLLLISSYCIVNAQSDSIVVNIDEIKEIHPQWIQKNRGTFDLSEVTFVNWNSGGSNSISALLGFTSSYDYKDPFFVWKNNANLRYGINQQEEKGLLKTDDLLELNSNLGFKTDSTSHWFYSAKFNFRTQFTDGFNYPNRDEPVSRLLAPGYLFFGAGMEYSQNIDKLSFYFSPLTLKTTFVLDEDLANAGTFGVTPAVLDAQGNIKEPGKKVRNEFGILLTNTYETEVAKNVILRNRLSLYSDYINKFGNIDIDWNVDFDFRVNSFIRANFTSHIRYDDDVKTQKSGDIAGTFERSGPRIQWKQLLAIGVSVDF